MIKYNFEKYRSRRITDVPELPERERDSHKGQFGRILVIAGSRAMIGAPSLIANAAYRCGAGLVRMALPDVIQLTVANLAPCATSIILPQDQAGRISRAALDLLLEAWEDNDILAVGPGLGQSDDLKEIVRTLVTKPGKPVVLDADGLNNLAAWGSEVPQLRPDVILTPHPGEMKRLWQAYFEEPLPAKRLEQAEKLSRRTGAIVVLKGAGTIVTDGQQTYLNNTGNPALATAGTGDVLTGCIAGLIAQKLSLIEGTILGVYAHGRAAEYATDAMSEISLMATDLIYYLQEVLQDIQNGTEEDFMEDFDEEEGEDEPR